MRKISLQWRITLMSVLLIGAACVAMKLLICFSGVHYMDSIGASIQGYGYESPHGCLEAEQKRIKYKGCCWTVR